MSYIKGFHLCFKLLLGWTLVRLNSRYHEPPVPVTNFDPNAMSFDPNAMSFDPNAMSFDPTAASFDPNASSFDPKAVSFDPKAVSFNPNATMFDPNAKVPWCHDFLRLLFSSNWQKLCIDLKVTKVP